MNNDEMVKLKKIKNDLLFLFETCKFSTEENYHILQVVEYLKEKINECQEIM